MGRLVIIILTVLLSAAIAWFAEPLVRENTDFMIAVVTLFAVFGGFLVAVMSIAGEPLVSKDGSWRSIELKRDEVIHRMDRARLLFYSYLTSATLILIVLAFHKSCDPVVIGLIRYVNIVGLWFTTMGVLFSFALPSMLIGIQKDRIEGSMAGKGAPPTS
jgi:hypothetical protein